MITPKPYHNNLILKSRDIPRAYGALPYHQAIFPQAYNLPGLVIRLDGFPRTFIGKVLRREPARRLRRGGSAHTHDINFPQPRPAPTSRLYL